MGMGEAIVILRSGVLQILMMAAPMLAVGLGVGLIISILQATTSIQEQTLTFIPKIAAIFGSIIIFGPWILGSMSQFTIRLMQNISEFAK